MRARRKSGEPDPTTVIRRTWQVRGGKINSGRALMRTGEHCVVPAGYSNTVGFANDNLLDGRCWM